MISCTEFIPAYNELFKFLDKKGGKKAVVKFWENVSDACLNNLRHLAAKKGLAGCFEYFNHTHNEEAADFRMELDEDNSVLSIEMRYCPSMGRLLKEKHIEPYEFYCEHCDTLYRRAFEPLGFDYDIDLSQCGKAKCKAVIKKSTNLA
ncbi:MAG: hypothetical protein JXB29_04820 [Sedimentisphaerales bacterium]|nr:hypothetical protein [Sedimentisphaerales bacterium]